MIRYTANPDEMLCGQVLCTEFHEASSMSTEVPPFQLETGLGTNATGVCVCVVRDTHPQLENS